jgi:gluconolactonase
MGPSGLCQDQEGNFWICLYSGLKLAQFNQAGKLLQVFDSFQGAPFRGPSDIAMHASGEIYFTDGGDFTDDWVSGRPAGAVYALSPSGELRQLDQRLCYPNGIAISPDGNSLYVCEHRKNRVLRYALTPEGRVSHKEILSELDQSCLLEPALSYELGPDGMGLDEAGNLWVAHYGGGKLLQISPQGVVLQSVRLPRGRKPTNVKYSPPEHALYVTEAEYGLLYRLDMEPV